MNVGFVVHHYDAADGTGGYAVELVPRIAARHDVTLYAAAVRAPVPRNVRVVRVPVLPGSSYARILSFPLVFQAVRRPHDVVHAQGWVAMAADVVTAHIVLGAWRDAARQAAIPVRPGERWLGALVAGREAALFGRRARWVIAPSERARVDIARCYGRSDGVVVVHHGFPRDTSLPERDSARRMLGLPPDAFVALYAGDARKGFAGSVAALAAAPMVRLLVASRSTPGSYLELARARGVADRVHWAGATEDMRTVYAAADALLHPTIYDTFGMVVAEAMAYGLPVIVSREAGIVDLIEHQRSGWIVRPDGADSGEALLRLASDPTLRSRLAEGARTVARSRDWDAVATETLALYGRATARSP